MELFAKNNAVEPSERLRKRILDSTLSNFDDDSAFASQIVDNNDNIIALSAARSANFYKIAFAACLALLVVSGIALGVNIQQAAGIKYPISGITIKQSAFCQQGKPDGPSVKDIPRRFLQNSQIAGHTSLAQCRTYCCLESGKEKK